MREEVVIGDCSTSGGWTIIPSQCGGIHAPPEGTKTCKTHISVNGQSYNIRTEGFLDMQMYVARKSPEGERLDRLLKAEDWDSIDEMFEELVMDYANPELIRAKIKQAEINAYDRGYEDKAEEFRNVLGISRRW